MDMLRTCFCETQIDSTSINLEITESAVSFNFEEVNSILGEMKKLGVDIALDDFGTGYSSLSRERELHVDIIKIDKLFIDRMLSLKPEEAITQDIISMAHRLNQRVIAEGVENEQQLEYLQQFGCDMIQGYVMSKPVDHTLAYNLLTIHNPRGCKDT
jgi:EAL domain-containing protein (putative c-di-GMP-specific phosphodiesterase class I)